MAKILIADDRESMRMALGLQLGCIQNGKCVVGKRWSRRRGESDGTTPRPGCLGFQDARREWNQSNEICMSMPTTPIVMYTLSKTPALEVAAELVGIRQVIGKED
jgi:hypothetical protein